MDLLKFELRSFAAGAALVGALWALAHACALERDAKPANVVDAPPAGDSRVR